MLATHELDRSTGLVDAVALESFTAMRRCDVLVVEDDPMLAGIIGRLVTASGATAHVMTRAHTALHSLRMQHFDLLITDLCLNDGSGYDVAKTAREQQPDMLIAVSSGILGTEDERPPEADVYLHKPFRLEMIRKLVSRVVAA